MNKKTILDICLIVLVIAWGISVLAARDLGYETCKKDNAIAVITGFCAPTTYYTPPINLSKINISGFNFSGT